MEIKRIIDMNNPVCGSCFYKRGIFDSPDGIEIGIKPDDRAWEERLIAGAYCYVADLLYCSDLIETGKQIRKKGPIPPGCPKESLFRGLGGI